MSLWTFLFATSVAGMIFAYMMRSKELKHGAKPDARGARSPQQNFGNNVVQDNGSLEAIAAKLELMERRLQSLETIVIERERHSEFDNALNR